MLHNRNRIIIKNLTMKKHHYNDTKTETKLHQDRETTRISLLNIDEKITNKIPENMIQKNNVWL